MTRFAVIAHTASETNRALVTAARSHGIESALVRPDVALQALQPGDVALGRLDVRESLAGIENGVWQLRLLEREGVRVLNGASALVAAHDKLVAARCLRAAAIPHPRTAHVGTEDAVISIAAPLVLKPRFGSWGQDVLKCDDERTVEDNLAVLRSRNWFADTGVLAQELIQPLGYDLRLVVAAGRVVGAVKRVAAPGEWRTNVALGAARVPVDPPARACALAIVAAGAIGGDLVGVDLLPTGSGGFVVLEVNGAVEFTATYSSMGDIFAMTLDALLAREPTAAFA